MVDNNTVVSSEETSPREVVERLLQAVNAHDPEAMAACFAPDFQSEQPLHPERAFRGPEGVRRNWTAMFAATPDLRVETLRWSETGNTVWAEMHFWGTQADGSPFELRGTTIQAIEAGRIAWARLSMDPVQPPS